MKHMAMMHLVFALTLSATTLHIPSEFPTIQAGLDSASAGDTVQVASGTYNENLVWPATPGIVLIGSGESSCTIDGNDNGTVIAFSEALGGTIDTTTQLSGFTIRDGANYNGGGILLNNASPVLSNLTITECYGSGLRINSSDPVLKNLVIQGNDGGSWGGGINCWAYSSPILSNVKIIGNEAAFGGGFHAQLSNPIITNSLISGNSATYLAWSGFSKGGGLSSKESDIQITNTIICDNETVGWGGGIYLETTSLDMANVQISNNKGDRGGGIYVDKESPVLFSSLDRCDIYSNKASIGSDIYSLSPIDVVVDTFTVYQPTDYYVASNKATTFNILTGIKDLHAVDLYVSVAGDDANDGLSPSSPLRTINHAQSIIYGDSLHPRKIFLANGEYSPSSNGETFPIQHMDNISLVGEIDSEVILNAEGLSRVMQVFGVKSSSVLNLTLTGGYARRGGGIHILDSSPTFENTIITFNEAYDISNWAGTPPLGDGGGVYSVSSDPTFVNTVISSNQGNALGGGLYFVQSNPILLNVTITANSTWDARYNQSFGGGGIALVDSSTVTLANSICWNNGSDAIKVEISSMGDSVIVSHSDIEGGIDSFNLGYYGNVFWGSGNIDVDPAFCYSAGGDYRLSRNSPCVGTGEMGGNMGAYEVGCESATVDVDNGMSDLPLVHVLHQNFPNPFNPTTNIRYGIPENSDVILQIFDIMGREMTSFVWSEQAAGWYNVQWSGLDKSGSPVSTGTYFARLHTEKYSKTIKMVYLK